MGLASLTGLDTTAGRSARTDIFYVNQVMQFGKAARHLSGVIRPTRNSPRHRLHSAGGREQCVCEERKNS